MTVLTGTSWVTGRPFLDLRGYIGVGSLLALPRFSTIGGDGVPPAPLFGGCSEPLRVYHFSVALRKPTVKIAAPDRWKAIAEFARLQGLTAPVPPKYDVDFRPKHHQGVVLYADCTEAEAEECLESFPDRRPRSRTRYGDAEPAEYPLLTHFGRASIRPEWVIDRQTGTVRVAGEFASLPRYFLDLSDRPTADDVRRMGGKVNAGGGLDVQARFLNDMCPWLNLEDGEDLRIRLLDEVSRYERKHH